MRAVLLTSVAFSAFSFNPPPTPTTTPIAPPTRHRHHHHRLHQLLFAFQVDDNPTDPLCWQWWQYLQFMSPWFPRNADSGSVAWSLRCCQHLLRASKHQVDGNPIKLWSHSDKLPHKATSKRWTTCARKSGGRRVWSDRADAHSPAGHTHYTRCSISADRSDHTHYTRCSISGLIGQITHTTLAAVSLVRSVRSETLHLLQCLWSDSCPHFNPSLFTGTRFLTPCLVQEGHTLKLKT